MTLKQTSTEIEKLCREVLKNFKGSEMFSHKDKKLKEFNRVSKKYNLSNKTLEHVKTNVLEIAKSETKYRNGIKK